MAQTVTNVVMMPEPSDKNSSQAEASPASSGHRSTHRASALESPAGGEKAERDSAAGITGGDARATSDASSSAEPSTEVFAVFGVEPEIQAYAMAKYSRSSLSMKESLREISTQKAEKFLNTFYFQYGHRSIADLAHIAFAIERLSSVRVIFALAFFAFAFLRVVGLLALVFVGRLFVARWRVVIVHLLKAGIAVVFVGREA